MARLGFVGLQVSGNDPFLIHAPFMSRAISVVAPSGFINWNFWESAGFSADHSLRTRGRATQERVIAEVSPRSSGRGTPVVWSGNEIARISCHEKGAEVDVRLAVRNGLTQEERLNAMNAGLDAAFALQGLVLLHASAFALDRHSVIVVGPSHSGKSTLAAAAWRVGGQAIADDTVVLRLDSADSETPSVRAAGLSSTIWLREVSARAFRAKHEAPVMKGTEKRWRLATRRAESDLPWMEVDMVWFPSIHHGRAETTAGRIASSEALARLLQSSSALLTDPALPRARETVVGVLTRLVNAAPAYELALGRDLLDRPELLLPRLLQPAEGTRPPYAGEAR